LEIKKNNIYFENLDGLRGIAAFAVLFFHASIWVPSEGLANYKFKTFISFSFEGGKYGVIFFFILSGFLISFLLLNEQNFNKKINLGKFYVRRILRIWPLYYLTLFVGFFIYPLLDPYLEINSSLTYYSFFITNFHHLFYSPPNLGILGVQWSIAIEEQFYLLWPIIFLIKRTDFKFIIISLIVIIANLFYFKNIENSNITYYHTVSCTRYLGFGALISFLAYYKKDKLISFLSKIPKALIYIIYIFSLIAIFNSKKMNLFFGMDLITELFPTLFFSFIILEQNYNTNSVFKIGHFNFLNWLGKISYGIYLTHIIAIYIINNLFSFWDSSFFIIKLGLVICLTLLISSVSYKYIEGPFIKLKKHFN
jgi:peptidoglycan/LPS O-acetylase OafA/YrhL